MKCCFKLINEVLFEEFNKSPNFHSIVSSKNEIVVRKKNVSGLRHWEIFCDGVEQLAHKAGINVFIKVEVIPE